MQNQHAGDELSRRAFLKLTSLTGAGLAFGSFTSIFPSGCGPARPENQVRFSLIGDFGETTRDGVFPVDRLAPMIKSWNTDFLISLGDINYEFGEAGTMDVNVGKNFGEFVYPKGESPHPDWYPYPADAPRRNRFFSVLGNHDYADSFSDLRPTAENIANSRPYVEYLAASLVHGSEPVDLVSGAEGRVVDATGGNPRPFHEDPNIRFFDFRRGVVHFFMLDSNPPSPYGRAEDGVQGRWLRQRLAASDAPWKIVCFHHPPYASGVGAEMMEIMRWPFRGWGADLVVCGHVHSYERLQVPDPGTEGPPLTYIVNGAGGFIPESGYDADNFPGSVVRVENYGAQLVVADEESLTLLYYDIEGTLRDSHVLFRDEAVGPSEIEFTKPELRVDAGGGRAVVRVRRAGSVDHPAAARFATATGTALAGTDFNPVAGTLEFAPGEREKEIHIPLLLRATPEAGLRFNVALSHPSRRTNLGFFRSLSVALIYPALSPLRDVAGFVQQTFEDLLYRHPAESELEVARAALGDDPSWLQKADWVVHRFFLSPEVDAELPRQVAAVALLANANAGAQRLGYAQIPTRANILNGLQLLADAPDPDTGLVRFSEVINRTALEYLKREYPKAWDDPERFVGLIYGYVLGFAAKPEDIRYWKTRPEHPVGKDYESRCRMLAELAVRSFSPTPAHGMTPMDLPSRMRGAVSLSLLYAGVMREQIAWPHFERKLPGADRSTDQLADLVLGALQSAAYARRFRV